MIKKVQGDIVELALNGEFDVLVHGTNAFHIFDGNLARRIEENFPEAAQADLKTKKGDLNKLGNFSQATIVRRDTVLTVVNAYIQFHCRGNGNKVDYSAVKRVFGQIALAFSNQKIALLAISESTGGDWGRIAAILDEVMRGVDVTVVEPEPEINRKKIAL